MLIPRPFISEGQFGDELRKKEMEKETDRKREHWLDMEMRNECSHSMNLNWTCAWWKSLSSSQVSKFSLLAWVIGLPNEFVICRAEAAKSGGRINKLDKRSDGQNRVTCRRRTNEQTVYCWTHSLGIGQGSSDTITYSRLFSLMFDCDEEQRSIWIVGTTKIHVSITQSGTSVVFPGDVGHLEFLFKTKSQKLFISAFSSTFPRNGVLHILSSILVGGINKFPSICNNTNLAIK